MTAFRASGLGLLLAAAALPAAGTPQDDPYLAGKRQALTAVWTAPFGYDEIRSNHAPAGPFLGNGDVGLVSHTTATGQTLMLSKVDFVTDGRDDWAGHGAAALPAGGVRIAVEAAATAGFRYEMDQLGAELRMTTGTAAPVRMVTWMSPTDNFVVTELRTAGPAPLRIRIDTYTTATPEYAATASAAGEVAQVTRQSKTGPGIRWVSRVGLSTRVVGSRAEVAAADSATVRSTFVLAAGRPVYVVTYVSGGGTQGDARLDLGLKRLGKLSPRRLAALRRAKEAWWDDMWTRSYAETGDSLIDRHYLSSLYLLASAYNLHSPACGGMYGVWNMDDEMMYHGDIHLNYNSQAGFYSLFSANRPELAMPFLDFVERMLPEGRRRAREDMASLHPSRAGRPCRGPLFPVSALGIGSFYGGYWQQTMNAPFCMPFFNWYYEYTGDEDFLRRRAYPFIREIGDFYEDYLDKEPSGDTYRYTLTTGGHENSWDLNPPSDLGFVEQTFRLLLRYSEKLGVDAARRAHWRDIVGHLPRYKVIMPTRRPHQGLPVYAKNEAGWDWPAHVIQLHPVYPCELINLHSPAGTLKLARNTLHYYGVAQQGFTETMNELGLSAFIMGARIGFPPETLMDKMRTLIAQAGRNFLIRDGHHCLEKTTVVETVNSMMLQSVDSTLHLFPCWPRRPASFVRLRAKGAFLVSAERDRRQVTRLRITSERGNDCRLVNPWPGHKAAVRRGGRPVTLSAEGDTLTFATRAGATYEVSRADGAGT